MEAIMAEPLITESQLAQLLANGARSAAGEDIDPRHHHSVHYRWWTLSRTPPRVSAVSPDAYEGNPGLSISGGVRRECC